MTVDKYIEKSVHDQIFSDHSLLRFLERKIGTEMVRGGDNILIPVGTAENTGGSSYTGYQVFDTDPEETITNAFYNIKKYQQPIVAPAEEVLRNRSEEGVIDMWQAKADVAMSTLRSRLNQHAFDDGTGNSGLNILGLTILIDSTGTVGGIARGSNAFWAAQELPSGGALAIDTSVGMLQLYNNCSTGSADNATPDLIMTTQAVSQSYENLLAPDIRHTSGGTGEGAFSGLAYKGVPLEWDSDATSQVMYMINSNTYHFYIHPDRNFFGTEIARADNGTLQQDAWIKSILLWCELVAGECRRNGKLTGVTAS